MYNIFSYKLLSLFFLLFSQAASAQQYATTTNLAALEGIDITPDNIFNYSIYSSFDKTVKARVIGTIRYRGSEIRLKYTFDVNLNPGANDMRTAIIYPQWDFSRPALKKLFFEDKMLPQGIYEYCVSIQNFINNPELNINNDFEDCIYHKANDIFLINLITPDDKAKLYELNPLFSWVVNYSASTMLTYRIRIAEIMKGQNKVNAIMRNNPVYSEKSLIQNSIVYPTFAKPLKKYQPYVWTVDAYYGDILLGGAEPWEFIIIEDSVFKPVLQNLPYVDIKIESGTIPIYAQGELKIKYALEDVKTDTLQLRLVKENGAEIKLEGSRLSALYGDNRYVIDLAEKGLSHGSAYLLTATSLTGTQYVVKFTYYNPSYVK